MFATCQNQMLMLCRRKILAHKFLNDKKKIERRCGYKKIKKLLFLKKEKEKPQVPKHWRTSPQNHKMCTGINKIFTKPLALFLAASKRPQKQDRQKYVFVCICKKAVSTPDKRKTADSWKDTKIKHTHKKCVHSFPQAPAGSQERVSWYQLTPTHKMASMRLYSNSETLCARGSEN